jgi:multisubunit Na+/H+ antiporter MnhB subunit
MEVKKMIGGFLALSGAAIFYSAFTEGATEWLTNWIIQNAPHIKGKYSAKDLLIAWGGMMTGIGLMMLVKRDAD